MDKQLLADAIFFWHFESNENAAYDKAVKLLAWVVKTCDHLPINQRLQHQIDNNKIVYCLKCASELERKET